MTQQSRQTVLSLQACVYVAVDWEPNGLNKAMSPWPSERQTRGQRNHSCRQFAEQPFPATCGSVVWPAASPVNTTRGVCAPEAVAAVGAMA